MRLIRSSGRLAISLFPKVHTPSAVRNPSAIPEQADCKEFYTRLKTHMKEPLILRSGLLRFLCYGHKPEKYLVVEKEICLSLPPCITCVKCIRIVVALEGYHQCMAGIMICVGDIMSALEGGVGINIVVEHH